MGAMEPSGIIYSAFLDKLHQVFFLPNIKELSHTMTLTGDSLDRLTQTNLGTDRGIGIVYYCQYITELC